MKLRNSFLPLLIICVNLAGHSHAATSQYWNAGGTGGDGIWGTGPGDKNWNLIAGAPAGNTTWPDTINDVAVFQDALGGTVTVFDPVQAAGISQTGANYTINAGTITLVPDSTAASPFVNVQTGTLTLDSALAGSNGLIKSGGGNLLLTSANTFTGTTAVTAGTLTLTGSIASTTINITSGANLLDQSGGLASATVLTNAGTLTINAADTIASLTNNAGTVNGTGTLTVTGATVFNGGTLAAPLTVNGSGGGTFTNATIAGTFNGSTSLDGATVSGTVNGNTTSTGNVLVSGTIGGGPLSVTGGTLTLTGFSTNTPVDISAPASLIDANGGLAATTILTNAGTLTVNSADTVNTYTQNGNGTLAGTGALTATGGATLNSGTISGNLLGNINSTGTVLVSGAIGGGSLSVTSGALTLTGTSTNTPVDISAPASLIDANGGLAATTILTNAGTLTVNAADTVNTYTQNGNGTLAGTGALTTTGGATLNDGTVSGNLLGNINSTGTVLVSGTIGGGSLSVTGGTLTLTGTSTNTPVDISASASLIDSNGGLAATSIVTNAGTLTVNAADTVNTYTQNGNGTLAGTGALTTTGGATLNGGTVSGNLLGNTTSTGNVLVSGTIGGGSLSVTGGSLTLTGTSTNTPVDISALASLIDANGGLAATSMVTNAGTLAVNAADTVNTYTQNGNGTLAGTGALTTTGGATLNGGTISGNLLGNITSTGTVLVSGTVGDGSLSVTGGTLTLTGTSTNTPVTIAAPATLIDSNGGLDGATVLTNAGTVVVNAADTVLTYTQNGGGILAGAATLTATNGATLNGGTVSGNLLGSITSTGTVLVSGEIGGGSLSVTGGTLTLTGTSANTPVNISSFASLVDSNGGFDSNAIVTNAGTLTVNAADAVKTYISNGGSLASGPGTLTAITSNLNNGSSVAGQLSANTITSNGGVSVSGTATADTIRISSGFLANSGLLGTTSTHLDIATGATLIAGGTQRYGLLTTSGPGAGTWQGNLINPATLAPGGAASTGALKVNVDFTNSSTGTLKMDVGRAGHDFLDVAGTATFGGTLDLARLGTSIAPFVSVQIVSANAYEGNFAKLEENLKGAVWFNPDNGTITRIPSSTGNGKFLPGATKNQTAAWISLYDDVIDPGTTNVTHTAGPPSSYAISSGIADLGNPELLRALAASFTPAGLLDTDLLNHLSPEVYASFADYATQATRTHQRTALTAPALARSRKVDSTDGITDSAKSSAKGVISLTPSSLDWELFAAADYFNVETDNSPNLADYELSGTGVIAGARAHLSDRIQLAGYIAGDDGSINGSLINSDGSGWSVGVIGEALLEEKTRTHLTTAISRGRYNFGGTRESVSATTAGWSHGRVHFSDVDSDSLELFAGLETTVYQNERIRIIPSAGLRYATGSTEGFTESTPAAPGSPIALDVGKNSFNSLLAEMGITAETDLTDQLTIQGQLGFNAGIGEDSHNISATFAKGSRPMHVNAEGLGDNLIFIGLGATYQINESISIGVGYRAEVRSDVHTQQGFNVSSSFRF